MPCSVQVLFSARPASSVRQRVVSSVQLVFCAAANMQRPLQRPALSSVQGTVPVQRPVYCPASSVHCPVQRPASSIVSCAAPRVLCRLLIAGQHPASCPASCLRSSILLSSVELPCNCEPRGVYLMAKPLWLVSQQSAELELPTANVLFNTAASHIPFFVPCMQPCIAYLYRIHASTPPDALHFLFSMQW